MGLEFPILTILKGATDDKLSNFIISFLLLGLTGSFEIKKKQPSPNHQHT